MSDQPAAQKRKPARRQAALSMRIAPATRDELVKRAGVSGRSVTQEADRLLQQALIVEELMGRTGLRPIMPALTDFITTGKHHAAALGIDGDWTEDPECYYAAAFPALTWLIAASPGPWDGKLWHTYLTQALISAEQRRTRGLGGFVADEEEP